MRRIEPFSADGKHVWPNGSDAEGETTRPINRLRKDVQHWSRRFADGDHIDVRCRPQARSKRTVSERSADETSRVGGPYRSEQNLT